MMRLPAACFLIALVVSTFAAETVKVTIEPLTFTAPEGIVSVPVTSPMRKAHWQWKKADQVVDVTFFAFGSGQGGDVNSNLQRWFGQFSGSEGKTESARVEVNGIPITFARAEGTFASGMPGGPMTPLPNQALCGAILETKSGLIFVKMTGPIELVREHEKAFTEMVRAAAK
ncbi:MAG TPA: hypothetical protein VIT21_04010 [Chthoniobacterales bacterium]